MSMNTPSATLAASDAQKTALRLALRITASEKWDLNRRFPVVMSRASGAHVWDVNGKQYVDFTSCSGAAPLGAGYEPVLAHVATEMRRTGGILPGPLSVHRVEVAERLAEIFPVAQRSVFFRTGSCATTAAVRLARAHTGVNLLLTSEYHGWHDWHLQDRPAMGLPRRDQDSVEFRYDLDLLEKLASVQRVAAVIITPEVNFFPAEYHRRLQTLVHQHGALLILDEVMTGFRYALGGYHTAVGLTPDLITLSKGLANGMALSAVAGRADVLNATEKTYLEPPNLGPHILRAIDLLDERDPKVTGTTKSTIDPFWYDGVHFAVQCRRFGLDFDDVRELVTKVMVEVANDIVSFADRCRLINEIGEFRRAHTGARRWGLKLQRKIAQVDSYARLWPRAHFVHIVRDGRDLAASHLKTVPDWGTGPPPKPRGAGLKWFPGRIGSRRRTATSSCATRIW
ncbi:aminotransferase class III-fold pyridoxal phosphate-dependent enzyme [Bradyrhizobium valentinum]|uniref:aminotransferase class III-fold pyridoxal phosphate-dependent enzyme n=1 Tax=Bradyrhizobium valentinum TaxID=1518501 RepID=UPI0007109B65|nr:aminotransferase class III-fold pyridoxal phosphate-dependent enzyme [Bradyrhizobium valentinum]KRR08758.1 hypothetical protein CQ10_14445 [Bradyrhizobium valentinum]